MPAVAFVRGVPPSFSECVTGEPVDPPLDPDLAARQHDQYVAALVAGGYDVVEVPVDEDRPDSPFIEDTAIVVGERVLITRPGHPSRRAEVKPVAEVLGRWFPIHRLHEPATLDGGDVLAVGRTIFVGISRRTNRAGASAVAAIAEPQGIEVRTVAVARALHLKSGVTALDDATLLWHPAACPQAALEGFEVVPVPGDDPEAANVVRLADGRILVGEQHVVTAELVSHRGREAVSVDVSEFARADGGLTCLSIRSR